jgi:hypothetical protein
MFEEKKVVNEDVSYVKFDNNVIIPYVLFKLINGNCFFIYCVIKLICVSEGQCFKTLKILADQCGVDIRTLRKVKKELSKEFPLIGKPLIKIEKQKINNGGDAPDIITIVNIWPENNKYIKEMKI